jgi:hypothetical protein
MTNPGDYPYSLFAFEPDDLPEQQRVVAEIIGTLRRLQPFGEETFVVEAHSLEAAAEETDRFKAKTCGSAFNLALLNLNGIAATDELKFLLQPAVSGGPTTLFLASLSLMQGDIYATAREKVEREAGEASTGRTYRSPSCIYGYSPALKHEAVERCAALLSAYLEEAADRAKARREGGEQLLSLYNSPVTNLFERFGNVFSGRKSSGVTGRYRAMPRAGAHPTHTPTLGPHPQGETTFPPAKPG